MVSEMKSEFYQVIMFKYMSIISIKTCASEILSFRI
jgi:hypothetical protein